MRVCQHCKRILYPEEIFRVERVKANFYRVEYLCRRCRRKNVYTVKRLKITLKSGDTTFEIYANPDFRELSIILKRKTRGRHYYIEHEIINKSGEITHIGVEGIEEWEEDNVNFTTSKGRKWEFVLREYGRKTCRWRIRKR